MVTATRRLPLRRTRRSPYRVTPSDSKYALALALTAEWKSLSRPLRNFIGLVPVSGKRGGDHPRAEAPGRDRIRIPDLVYSYLINDRPTVPRTTGSERPVD